MERRQLPHRERERERAEVAGMQPTSAMDLAPELMGQVQSLGYRDQAMEFLGRPEMRSERGAVPHGPGLPGSHRRRPGLAR